MFAPKKAKTLLTGLVGLKRNSFKGLLMRLYLPLGWKLQENYMTKTLLTGTSLSQKSAGDTDLMLVTGWMTMH